VRVQKTKPRLLKGFSLPVGSSIEIERHKGGHLSELVVVICHAPDRWDVRLTK
jgi:hypothetical protein